MDVEEQTEVIRVPKHNNVDALEIMNDFITVIRESIHYQSCNNYPRQILACLIKLYLKES